MKFKHIHYSLSFLLILIVTHLFGQEPLERVVFLESEIINDSVHLSWNEDITATHYTILTRPLDSPQWGSFIDVVPANVLAYSFPLPIGQSMEIAVYKSDPFLYRDTINVPEGEYIIEVMDEFGKGLCCNFGQGYYELKKENQTIFRADDFGFEVTDTFLLDTPAALYLEIQPDLFGNHLGWEILNTERDSVVSEFGPLGTYLRRAPSLGMIAVTNKQSVPLPNKSILVLVEQTMFDSLGYELDDLTNDLKRAGYFPKIIPVDKTETPVFIKSIIQDEYNSLSNLEMVYLIGRVPVPYSGDMYPDTHSDTHKGAWAADLYYADLDGVFTDTLVNETSAFFERTHNIPGDGKFDQSLIPSELEIMVSRVDLYDMGYFSDDELTLTRNYLQKAHDWKIGLIEAQEKGIVDDNFERAFGAPGSNGWRNLASLLGPDNVSDEDFRTALNSESHLWAYGCGSGTNTSSNGVATSEELAGDSLQVIFLMTFGSNFGDWDYHDNFLRAPLASGTTLSNAWVGNPHWFFHQMGIGRSLGEVSWKNMKSDYLPGPQSMHVALMGDPTINQYPVKAIPEYSIFQSGSEMELNWEAPTNTDDYQYRIYHRSDTIANWTLINTAPIADTFYMHSSPNIGSNYYLIQPTKLITNNSGCYYQPGLGVIGQSDFVTFIENHFSDQLRFWPNPADSFLMLTNATVGEQLKIFDQKGRLLIEEKVLNGFDVKIDISRLPSGVYLIRCGKANGRFLKVDK